MLEKHVNILSLVRDSATNNDGFWIGWLDLLTPSWSQSITITHNQSPSEDSLRSRSPVSILLQLLTSLSVLTCPPFITSGKGPNRNHHLQRSTIIVCLFIGAETCLATRTQQRVSFYCWEHNFGNVFTELLPSNGRMRHNINNLIIRKLETYFRTTA
jgi:hypothetical protein